MANQTLKKRNKSKRNSRQLFKRMFICVLVFIILLCSVLPSVNAASAAVKKGFVELQTVVPPTFNEIIEVVLTDKNTEYYYTDTLYKQNNYQSNLSVPLGTYTVTARVVSETQNDLSNFGVICPTEDIVVQNAHLATAIPLRVEEIGGVEVSGEDYSVEEEPLEENEISVDVEYEPVNETESSDAAEKKDSSLLVSTLIFLGLFAVLTVAFLLIKRRENNNR